MTPKAIPRRIILTSLLVFASQCLPAFAAGKSGGVDIQDTGDKLVIKIGGELFTEYYYKNVPRPYFYPVMGPGEVPMTRNYPMKNVDGEEHDHPHHRSLWFTHGEINGQDLWAEGTKSGKTVHVAFTEIKSGPEVGIIRTQDKYVSVDGAQVCSDDRTIRIYNHSKDRLMDFEVTLHATEGDLTFGDTKEGSMALRLAETMRLKKNRSGVGGQGHIVNSEGVRDDKTWGKRAKWCDYYGPVEGKTVGVAIFDNPENPRYPTWWHVRDYGLFAANPFGRHDFENLPDKKAGNLVIPEGKSVTFKYRIYFHEGDEKQAKVAEHYDAYVHSSSARSKAK